MLLPHGTWVFEATKFYALQRESATASLHGKQPWLARMNQDNVDRRYRPQVYPQQMFCGG